jgi:CRISPR system Cascade subunit CasC
MNRFKQIIMLKVFPPSNLNRDMAGLPKMLEFGGTIRGAHSPQSNKSAWRLSDVFREALAGDLEKGKRTKKLGVELFGHLKAAGASEKRARELAIRIASVFSESFEKPSKTDETMDLCHKTLFFYSKEEWDSTFALADRFAKEKTMPSDDDLMLLRKTSHSADLALFGRMVADHPEFNVEAALSVGWSYTISEAAEQDDEYAAVDDMKRERREQGAGHLDTKYFNEGIHYLHTVLNSEVLLENLGGDEELAKKVTRALVKTMVQTAPRGQISNSAAYVRSHYVLATRGNDQPFSLCNAFVDGMDGKGDGGRLIIRASNLLFGEYDRLVKRHDVKLEHYVHDVSQEKGSMEGLLEFVAQ